MRIGARNDSQKTSERDCSGHYGLPHGLLQDVMVVINGVFTPDGSAWDTSFRKGVGGARLDRRSWGFIEENYQTRLFHCCRGLHH